MDLSKTLEEIGKFFNEILGYLLPGFTFNLMVYLTLNPKYFPLLNEQYLLNPWVVIFLSYIMGYCIYGITISRDTLLKILFANKFLIKLKILYIKVLQFFKSKKVYHDPKTLIDNIINVVSRSEEFRLTKTYLIEQVDEDINNWEFNSVRNLVMSYMPEMDQKIYTFMFRSELGNHIGFVFFLFGLWLLLSRITSDLFDNTILIKQNLLDHLYDPFLIILLSYFFHITRKRFLLIAYKIPFSIFISKIKPIK